MSKLSGYRAAYVLRGEGRGRAPWGTEAQELDQGLGLLHLHREEIHTPQNQRLERMANVGGWAVYPNISF